MPRLLLAANEISPTLGVFSHLQAVREDDNGSLTELEVQAPTSIILGRWDFATANGVVRDHANLDNTPNYGDPNKYKAIEINLTRTVNNVAYEASVDSAWHVMSQVQDQMASHALNNPFTYNYDVFYNSNSFVNTLLFSIGVELQDSNPSQQTCWI